MGSGIRDARGALPKSKNIYTRNPWGVPWEGPGGPMVITRTYYLITNL